jgi:hypothetical protein
MGNKRAEVRGMNHLQDISPWRVPSDRKKTSLRYLRTKLLSCCGSVASGSRCTRLGGKRSPNPEVGEEAVQRHQGKNARQRAWVKRSRHLLTSGARRVKEHEPGKRADTRLSNAVNRAVAIRRHQVTRAPVDGRWGQQKSRWFIWEAKGEVEVAEHA